jgi:hypothetical protein
MKPHEQDWTVLPTEFGPWTLLERGNRIGTIGDGCTDRSVADLAASAPDLVRVLLELEWTAPGDLGAISACPICYRWQRDGHYPHCQLSAALIKAGVRTG